MIYYAINNTDDGGQAIVIEFEDKAALEAWLKQVEQITSDDDEPFGFRAETGIAQRILSPAEGLAMIPDWKRQTYTIVRRYEDESILPEVIATEQTLAEAQEYCKNPERSSRTATSAEAKARTEKYGRWFDSYEAD